MQPSPDEIREWEISAKQRNAILPQTISMSGRYVTLVCGHCEEVFKRKMLYGRSDPIFVCPTCTARNYVPIEW